MHDPRTFWLVVTNILLGLAVILLVIGVATHVLCDFVAGLRKRRTAERELDQDLKAYFGRGTTKTK